MLLSCNHFYNIILLYIVIHLVIDVGLWIGLRTSGKTIFKEFSKNS